VEDGFHGEARERSDSRVSRAKGPPSGLGFEPLENRGFSQGTEGERGGKTESTEVGS
jgi:hypothetical protein